MPQVSKRFLSEKVSSRITETLLEAISQLKEKSDIQLFINDLLTPVERVMIAKRLAVAVLLLKKWSYPSIKDFLKVSNQTVAKVSLILKTNSGYQITIDKLMRTEAGKEFWKDLTVLLHRIGTTSDTFKDEQVLRNRFGFNKKKTLI